MLGERVVPQSAVIRATLLDDSPCVTRVASARCDWIHHRGALCVGIHLDLSLQGSEETAMGCVCVERTAHACGAFLWGLL